MRRILRIYILIFICMAMATSAQAFWMWTPETNKWINPKYAAKDTPKEQLEYALDFFKSEDYEGAIKEFGKLLKHYPRAREAAEAQFYIGLSQFELGLYFKAFESYQIVIKKYPFSERSPDIVRRQYEIGNLLMEGRGKSTIVKKVIGNEYNVIEVFRTIIKNEPYGKYAAQSQYKIGLYLLEKKLYQEARDEFEKTINDYPDTEWAKASQFQIARSDAKRSTGAEYDQQITQSAVEEFKGFVEQYPDAELSNEARKQIKKLREKEAENAFLVAKFYEKQKNFQAAKIYYNTVVDDYRDSQWASKALTKIRELNKKIETIK